MGDGSPANVPFVEAELLPEITETREFNNTLGGKPSEHEPGRRNCR